MSEVGGETQGGKGLRDALAREQCRLSDLRRLRNGRASAAPLFHVNFSGCEGFATLERSESFITGKSYTQLCDELGTWAYGGACYRDAPAAGVRQWQAGHQQCEGLRSGCSDVRSGPSGAAGMSAPAPRFLAFTRGGW